MGRLCPGLRWLATATLSLLLLGLLFAQTAHAFNIYNDHLTQLSARWLGMGGASAAQSGLASVFANPAGLAGMRRFSLLYNHSARHFPGSREGGSQEWDQLDADAEALVVPFPLFTYAHGFTFSGEHGYDYSGHPVDSRLGYPRERLWGTVDVDALAFGAGLPAALGTNLRREVLQFNAAPEDSDALSWLRLGEGSGYGVQARVWPGLDYGYSRQNMAYDWTVRANKHDQNGWPGFGSKHVQQHSGWCLRPVGWLSLSQDEITDDYIFDKHGGMGLTPSPFLGRLHQGNQQLKSSHSGAELNVGNMVRISRGSYDGHPSLGMALNLGGLWLNYSEVESLLPDIVGSGAGFEDVHIYGAEWAW
jgi:hypothetical protein